MRESRRPRSIAWAGILVLLVSAVGVLVASGASAQVTHCAAGGIGGAGGRGGAGNGGACNQSTNGSGGGGGSKASAGPAYGTGGPLASARGGAAAGISLAKTGSGTMTEIGLSGFALCLGGALLLAAQPRRRLLARK